MNVILAILLAFLGLFGIAAEENFGTSESGSCAASTDGETRCGPTLINDEYQLPPSGWVISAVVNNGPVPPEYQAGYIITIEYDGHITLENTPVGATEPIVSTGELGVDGLQTLLRDLETAGFFYLPLASEFDDSAVRVGGDVSILSVSLNDGSWNVFGAPLQDSFDRDTLERAQLIVSGAVLPIVYPETGATPIAQ